MSKEVQASTGNHVDCVLELKKNIVHIEPLEAGNITHSIRYIKIKKKSMTCQTKFHPISVFHHDIARSYCRRTIMETMQLLGSQVISHSPYKPYLASYDFFSKLKKHLKGTKFGFNKEVKLWFNIETEDLFKRYVSNN